MIRLLVVNTSDHLGGAELLTLAIAEKLDPQIFDVAVACNGLGLFHEKLDRRKVQVFPLDLDPRWARTNMISLIRGLDAVLPFLRNLGGILATIRRLWRIIREERIELVYVTTLKACVLGGIAGRLARRPVVYHLHNLIEREKFNKGLLMILRLVVQCCVERIVGISDAVVESARGLGVPRERLERIYNGIDLRALVPVHHEVIKGEWGLPHGLPTVGLVGRLNRWKGQDVFLRAAGQVGRPAHYLLIGGRFQEEEAYERELQQIVSALGLDGRVTFLGHRDDVLRLIFGLDIVVHASVEPEPFGLVIIEAMAAGKPVVATRAGAVVEIVLGGETGLLVPPGDSEALAMAIDRLLADPARARAMGEAGRQRVATLFTEPLMVRALEQCLVRCASQPRARA